MRLSRLILAAVVAARRVRRAHRPRRRSRRPRERHLPTACPSGDPERAGRRAADAGTCRAAAARMRSTSTDADAGARMATSRDDDVADVPRRRRARGAVLRRDARRERPGDRAVEHRHDRSRRDRDCRRRRGCTSISLNGAIQLDVERQRGRRVAGDVRPLSRVLDDLRRSRGVCTANWVRRGLDGVGRLLRRQSDERRLALLRGERGDARRTRERLERVAPRHAALRRAQRVRLRDGGAPRQLGRSSSSRTRRGSSAS